MKEYMEQLEKLDLFKGINKEELTALLENLKAEKKTYKKGEYIIREGERITEIGILLKGHLFIQSIDYWGNRSIISEIKEKDVFAEAYAVSSFLSLNDVIASEESVIIRLSVKKILISPDIPRQTLMQNLLGILAEKNRILVRKNGHLAKRTTREKLLSYLSEEEKKQNSPSFSIPFNRQELADFLSVDRSAMSSELGKLKKEGLIDFKKSDFILRKL